jgi:hypothetical protein
MKETSKNMGSPDDAPTVTNWTSTNSMCAVSESDHLRNCAHHGVGAQCPMIDGVTMVSCLSIVVALPWKTRGGQKNGQWMLEAKTCSGSLESIFRRLVIGKIQGLPRVFLKKVSNIQRVPGAARRYSPGTRRENGSMGSKLGVCQGDNETDWRRHDFAELLFSRGLGSVSRAHFCLYASCSF